MKKTILITVWILVVGILSGISIGCNARGHNANTGFAKTDSTTILENGSYFDGKTFVPFKEMIIRDGKIVSIGTAAGKTKGQHIALDGKYIIPGLIDAHVHISGSPTFPYIYSEPRLNANSSLNCGVTSLIDLFFPEDHFKAMKEQTAKSPEYYSSLIMSGPILTAPGGHGTEYGVPTRTITTVGEATTITNEVIDGGVDVIKVVYQGYSNKNTLTKEMVKAIVVAAHSRNKKVFVHIDLAAEAMDCIDAGVDVLAHMPVDSLTDEQLNKIKASGIIIIPTITPYQSLFEGHGIKYMSDSLLWQTARPIYLAKFNRSALQKPPLPESFLKIYPSIKFRENLSNCIKMKIPILAGTDAGNYAVFFGYSLHNEIEQYVLAGMPASDAICTATQNISMVFPGIKTGKIEAGYDADLVVLNADPLKDIKNTKSINMVIHKGAFAKMLSE